MSDTAHCEKCGLAYEIGSDAEEFYTCDDCGGYVGVEVPAPVKP